VERAAALVTTTSNDLMNLAIARSAKQLNPTIRTVVRLFDADFARKVQSFLKVDVAQSGSIDHLPWTTWCRCTLTPSDPPGEWHVSMSMEGHVIATKTFTVK
jgi:voltage-gated potassium channel Kch